MDVKVFVDWSCLNHENQPEITIGRFTTKTQSTAQQQYGTSNLPAIASERRPENVHRR